MDQNTEIEELLKENIRISRENNRMLHKIRRTHLWDVVSRILFYLIVIGVPLFIYRYYLADYVHELQQAYQNIKTSMVDLKELPAQLISGALSEERNSVRSTFE